MLTRGTARACRSELPRSRHCGLASEVFWDGSSVVRLPLSCRAKARMRHPERRPASCALECDRDSHCHWFSLECLILSEICDCQTERVCLDQVVWNGIAKEKNKVGG